MSPARHPARVPDQRPAAFRPLTGLPDDFIPLVPPADTFDALYGLELIEMAPNGDVARGRVQIRDELPQQAGVLHGGVLAALAEALAFMGHHAGCRRRGDRGDGLVE